MSMNPTLFRFAAAGVIGLSTLTACGGSNKAPTPLQVSSSTNDVSTSNTSTNSDSSSAGSSTGQTAFVLPSSMEGHRIEIPAVSGWKLQRTKDATGITGTDGNKVFYTKGEVAFNPVDRKPDGDAFLAQLCNDVKNNMFGNESDLSTTKPIMKIDESDTVGKGEYTTCDFSNVTLNPNSLRAKVFPGIEPLFGKKVDIFVGVGHILSNPNYLSLYQFVPAGQSSVYDLQSDPMTSYLVSTE